MWFSIPLSYSSVYWKLYFCNTKCKVHCTSNLTYLERSSELDKFGMIQYFPAQRSYLNGQTKIKILSVGGLYANEHKLAGMGSL